MIFEPAAAKARLKDFITKEFLEEGAILKDEQSLFASGVISSIGVIELLVFIQKDFNVTINAAEINVGNFDTLEQMMRLIQARWPKEQS
jgi:acyl carrier protein